jgi:hypothetical protein
MLKNTACGSQAYILQITAMSVDRLISKKQPWLI